MIGIGKLTAVASTMIILACAGPASAETRVSSSPAGATVRDVRGDWQKLGERVVNGRVDRDVIQVGRADGRFKSIEIKVDGSSLEMFEIKVTFGDGQTFEPKTRLVFDKSSRSRVIDLPGDKRVIKKVEFRYGNLPGGGNARVELWAKE